MVQQPPPERRLAHLDDSGKRCQLAFDVIYLRWNQSNDERRAAPRENSAVTVRYYSARRRHGDEADLARERPGARRSAVDERYLDDWRERGDQRDHDDARERRQPPRWKTPRRRAYVAPLHHRRKASKRR